MLQGIYASKLAADNSVLVYHIKLTKELEPVFENFIATGFSTDTATHKFPGQLRFEEQSRSLYLILG